MVHAFTIQPSSYNTFEDETEQIEQCKEWGLAFRESSENKGFFLQGKWYESSHAALLVLWIK